MKHILIALMLLVLVAGTAGADAICDNTGHCWANLNNLDPYATWPALNEKYYDYGAKTWKCYVGGTIDPSTGRADFYWEDCIEIVSPYAELVEAAEGVTPLLEEYAKVADKIDELYLGTPRSADINKTVAAEKACRDAAIKRFRDALKRAKGE